MLLLDAFFGAFAGERQFILETLARQKVLQSKLDRKANKIEQRILSKQAKREKIVQRNLALLEKKGMKPMEVDLTKEEEVVDLISHSDSESENELSSDEEIDEDEVLIVESPPKKSKTDSSSSATVMIPITSSTSVPDSTSATATDTFTSPSVPLPSSDSIQQSSSPSIIPAPLVTESRAVEPTSSRSTDASPPEQSVHPIEMKSNTDFVSPRFKEENGTKVFLLDTSSDEEMSEEEGMVLNLR